MKKIYSFIALMMLLFVGNAQAQRAWDLSGDLATEISTDKYYVLQEGSYTGWSGSEYLSVNGMIAEPNTPAVFQFVEAGEKECESGNVYPLYYLKSVENGLYLSSGDTRWVKGKTNAWVFSARIAEEKTLPDEPTWEDWSNAIQGGDRNGNSNGLAFIFTEDNDQSVVFMNYVGEPGFMSYWDTNDWFVYEVVEREISEYEKFVIFFNDAFKTGVDTDNYPIGENPGCVSEEVYIELEAAYTAGIEACADDAQSDEYYQAVRQQIEAALEAYNNGLIPVGPGHFVFVNQRSQDPMFDNNGVLQHTGGAGVPTEWNSTTAKYIWTVEKSDKEGRFYFRNFSTGRYVDALKWQSNGRTTSTVEAEETFEAVKAQGKYFAFIDEAGNQAHNAGDQTLCAWNDLTAAGGMYEIVKVDEEVIAALEGEVKQALLNAELKSLVQDAKALQARYKLLNGLTYDDMYLSAGLVGPEAMSTNAPEGNEGYSIENQFKQMTDGNLQTYFHTTWSNSDATTWHYVQVDLGKEVQKLTVKMSQRHNNRNGNPSKVKFVTCEDIASEIWDDTLSTDTVIYQYGTNFTGGYIDSTTAIMDVDFGKPVQHVRMAVVATKANQYYGAGPCWHVSELRFYEDLGPNPLYDMIPVEVRNALDAAINAAVAEITPDSTAKATQPTIDALEAAMEAFEKAYPNPAGLESLIEEAEAQAEAAVEGEEMGYFKTGAKEELLATVEQVKTAIDGKYLSLDELDKYEKQLKDALNKFAESLIKPAPGVYRIISASLTEEGESTNQTGSYIYAANAELSNSPKWGYASDDVYDTRWNLLWEVTVNEAGKLAFRNLATGRYLGNQFEGMTEEQVNDKIEEDGRDLVMSDKPVYFALQSAKVEGVFNIILADNLYMNYDPRQVMVGYHVVNDINARIVFEEVDELGDEYTSISVTANKLNAITLPYDVYDLYNGVLQVAGRSEEATTDEDGITTYEVYLTEYEAEEVIPAGTPFFYVADAEETYISLYHPEVTDLNGLLDMAISYEGKNKNGVLGTNASFEVEPGVGLLSGNEIVVAEEGDKVAAGSVIFGGAEDIPVFDGEASDAAHVVLLPVEVVSGKITGIENVVVAKQAAKGVYAISGVKVRNTNNVNGLPKGLYIVGGKKIIVK